MHPDHVLAGLRRELERFPERADEIKAEMAHVDGQPRPVPQADSPAPSRLDRARAYLAGLRRELSRAEKDRHKEISAEIKSVERDLKASPEPEPALEAAVEPVAEPEAPAEPSPVPEAPVAEPAPEAPAEAPADAKAKSA